MREGDSSRRVVQSVILDCVSNDPHDNRGSSSSEGESVVLTSDISVGQGVCTVHDLCNNIHTWAGTLQFYSQASFSEGFIKIDKFSGVSSPVEVTKSD